MKLKRQSKTLWFFGAIGTTLLLIELYAVTFQAIISPMTYMILTFISAAGGIVLRFFTDEAIR